MSSPNPRRLKQDPEFSDVLQDAAAEDELTPERLAHNGERVRQRIAALGLAATSLSPTIAAWLKLAAGGAIVAAVGTSVYVMMNPPTSVDELVESVPTLVAIATDTGTPAATPDVIATPVGTQIAMIAPTPREMTFSTGTPEATPVPTTADATVDSSALAEQLADFESARAAANRGEYDVALKQLDVLEKQWPDGPLQAEIELSRADYLVRSGRLQEATEVISVLVLDPAHAPRRAELYQVLGDLWIKLDNCPAAVKAYREVVAMDGEVDEGVSTGLAKCGSPLKP